MTATWRVLGRRLLAGGWLLVSGLAAGQPADGLPAGLSFLARGGNGDWGLYLVDGQGAAQSVPTQLEPRQACVAPASAQAVYAAADGSLRRLALPAGPETVLAQASAQAAYTQPCLSADGREVYAVQMADGRSIDTELVRWPAQTSLPPPAPQRFARQVGAQHEPYIHQGRWLVYASVGCAEGCDRLLVEIWARDLLAGTVRQLSLLNALSQAPVTDGRRVVFSSDASGSFQLWQLGWDGGGLRQLTQGPAQALQPALCGGQLLFVRASPQGAVLARLADDGSISEHALPGLSSVRGLRCVS